MIENEKYQRLAEEYGKLKQHVAILKKAVRDEQDKSSHLDHQVKALEIKLQSATEESENLVFNNARLAKRITLLQEALEEEKQKSSSVSSWFGSGTKQELTKAQQELSVAREELAIKIAENEDLHMRIFETSQEQTTIREDLQDRISKLKTDVQHKTDLFDDLTHQHKHSVARLTTENTHLQTKSEEMNETLNRTKSLMLQREHTMAETQQKLTTELNAAQNTIQQKIPFHDTLHPEANRWNLPRFDAIAAHKQTELIASSTLLFHKFSDLWKDWCDSEHEKILYLNRAASELPEEHRQLHRKIGGILAEYPDILQSLAQAFGGFMSTENPLGSEAQSFKQDFLFSYQRLVALHEKTASCFKSRLESENQYLKLFVNNDQAKSYNLSLVENYNLFHIQLEKIGSYLSVFCGALKTEAEGGPNASIHNTLYSIQNMNQCLEQCRSLFKERSSIVTQLVNLEEKTDSFLSNDVKLINTKRASSLSNASVIFDKLCDMMNQYYLTLAKPTQETVQVRGFSADFPVGLFPLLPLRVKSVGYLKSVNGAIDHNKSISVPYQDQLLHLEQIGQLKQSLKNKDLDLHSMKQQHAQYTTKMDQVLTELKQTKDTLMTKQKGIADLLAELAEAKSKIQKLLASNASVDSTLESPRSDTQQHVETAETADSMTSTNEGILFEAFGGPAGNLSTTQQHEEDLFHLNPNQNLASHLSASTHSSGSLIDGTEGPQVMKTETQVPMSPGSMTSHKPWSMIVLDESGHQSSSHLGVTVQDKEREEILKEQYEARVNQYLNKLEATDQKNVQLHQLMMELERKLKEAIAQKEALVKDLDLTGSRVQDGLDELNTTRSSYDAQLKMMTEHMMSLSDKISVYEEQLSQLKNSNVKCGICKAWNTVEWLTTEGKMGQRCRHGNHASSFNYG